MEQLKLLELIIASIPYPDQINDISFIDGYVIFTWKGTKFRVSKDMIVDEVGDDVVSASNIAIILEHLLKKTDLFRWI